LPDLAPDIHTGDNLTIVRKRGGCIMIRGHDLDDLSTKEKGRRVFERLICELMEAQADCVEAGHHNAAQILLYSSIDIMASLDRNPAKIDVDAVEFEGWIERYMLVGDGAKLPCTAKDLYAARCAILHTMTLESKKSRENKARLIFLAYKPADIVAFQEALDRAELNGQKGVAVYWDELGSAFSVAIMRFSKAIESDSVKAKQVYQRAGKIPVFLPASCYRPLPAKSEGEEV
jgi:hypothetical protein